VQTQSVILLVEDSEDDTFLLKRAFKKANVPNLIFTVRTGAEATLYLLGEGKYSDRACFPSPSLMLLDLKLPDMNGLDVLKWVRARPEFASLRVVVLSGVADEKLVKRAYQLGASSFLAKPSEYAALVQMSGSLRDFWLNTSIIPPQQLA
jgi:CheY-like chemotaxis protein